MKTIKVTKPIDLGQYLEAYAGQVVHVWVNPSRDLVEERKALMKIYLSLSLVEIEMKSKERTKRQKFFDWFYILFKTKERAMAAAKKRERVLMSQIWSQGEEREMRWSFDEITKLWNAEPALYSWLIAESFIKIDEFRDNKKK